MTKIKICGLVNENDIWLVNSLKTDFAGFVLFFPKSHRNLELDKAEKLIKGLDGIKSVAVTVSPTAEQARLICKAGFDYLQIHGELSEDTYSACEIPIIRAFNVSNVNEAGECGKREKIAACLFDAAAPGSGKVFDWDMLKSLPPCGKPVILAGGLTAENVLSAIEAVKPDCVDVSSGVELPQGGKDIEKARAFVQAVRHGSEV